MMNQVTDADCSFSPQCQTLAKKSSNCSQGSVNVPSRKIDDDEDDVDSLNINFDDVNEQSDLEEYYNNSPEQVINTNNSFNEASAANSKTDSCLYENPQNFVFNPRVAVDQITNSCKPSAAHRVQNSSLFMNSPISSPTNPALDNVLSTDFNSMDAGYGIPANTKSNNKNIHCIKEKIRR